MAIDPTTDEKFAFFDADERQFLARIGCDHPAIIDNFEKYLGWPSDIRFTFAKLAVDGMPRTGWVIKGIDGPETVYEHQHNLAQMIEEYWNLRIPLMPLPERFTAIRMRERMMSMAKIHDLPEVIVSDFTHHDHSAGKITAEDKERLEWLAARVILENEPRLMTVYQEIHEQKTIVSQLFHDMDIIHAVVGAVFYEAKYPEKTNLWPEFYPYAQRKMKTDAGKAYLEEVASQRDAFIDYYRNPPPQQQSVRAR